MTGLYLIFGFLLMGALAGAAYWLMRSYRIYKTNLLVSEELDKIISSTLETIQKNKRPGLDAAVLAAAAGDAPDMLDSPDLMSTIITVLINKFGSVRLNMQDFMISEDEYVSVYVDADTHEIILSLNHGLVQDDIYVGFKKSTDQTFH